MGGLIALHASLRKQEWFRGLILLGPLFALDPAASNSAMRLGARILARVMPTLGVGSLDPEELCSDKSVRDRMLDDALGYSGRATAGWACAMMDSMAAAHASFASVTGPLLVMHGGADRVCDVEGSRRLHAQAASEDKALIVGERSGS